MATKIALRDIDSVPCHKYHVYIMKRYGFDGEFDPMDVFGNVPGGLQHGDVSWLIKHCEKMQTLKMLEYYTSLQPVAGDVIWLMRHCEKARTPEMFEYYKSLNPDYDEVYWLIRECEFAQTKEMLKYFMSLNPSRYIIEELIDRCPFAKKHKRLLK